MTVYFNSRFQPAQYQPKNTKQPVSKASGKTQTSKFGYTSLFSDHELAIKASNNASVYLDDTDLYYLRATLPQKYELRPLYRDWDSHLWEVQIMPNQHPSAVERAQVEREKERDFFHHQDKYDNQYQNPWAK